MNAKDALEKLYAGDYQTAEGAGELARIVSEALSDAESTESLYLSTLAELSAIKKRAEEVVKMMNALNPADFGKDRPGWQPTIADYHEWLRQEINYIINGPKEGEGK